MGAISAMLRTSPAYLKSEPAHEQEKLRQTLSQEPSEADDSSARVMLTKVIAQGRTNYSPRT